MKFNWKLGKDKWLIILAVGLILLILSIPSGSVNRAKKDTLQLPGSSDTGDSITTAARADRTYEEQLERRVKQILKTVDGVGQVDVMIVLKSSEERVLRVDRDTVKSSTQEQDNGGGTRNITNEEQKESTILKGSGNNTEPIVEKEIKPEIAGIIISAQGGGSSVVIAEISAAMVALFDIPAHKIKVLKRVE